ncbi:extensin [Streptomyces sp. NPDC012950]|uniref:extensin n=1 Tax=Streptomyces sp. NPDC012950 TaxID=3364858 RepID=UPI0036CE6D72
MLPLATGRALAPSRPDGGTRTPAVRAAPLVTPAPAAPRPVVPLTPPAAARPVARPAAVQRRTAPEAPPAPAPVPVPVPLQRTAAVVPPAPRRTTAPVPAPVQRATTTPAGSTSTAPPSLPAPAESPTQLDELARRLVTPLSRLLRAELRADRERVGRLRDHGR